MIIAEERAILAELVERESPKDLLAELASIAHQKRIQKLDGFQSPLIDPKIADELCGYLAQMHYRVLIYGAAANVTFGMQGAPAEQVVAFMKRWSEERPDPNQPSLFDDLLDESADVEQLPLWFEPFLQETEAA